MKTIQLLKFVVIGLPIKRVYHFDCDLSTFKKQIRQNIHHDNSLIEVTGKFSGLYGKRLNLRWTRRLKYLRYKYGGAAHSSLKIKSSIVSSDVNEVVLDTRIYSNDRYIFWILYFLIFMITSIRLGIKLVLFDRKLDIESFANISLILASVIAILSIKYMIIANRNIDEFNKLLFEKLEYKTVSNNE